MLPIYTGVEDVKDGDSPFYTDDSSNPPYVNAVPLSQASGSGLDSDTVQGITAVTARVGGPNKLVATDNTGAYPFSTLPIGGATPGAMVFVSGAYASLKASPPATVALCLAIDQGVAGALYLYTANASAGDSGFVLLGGS